MSTKKQKVLLSIAFVMLLSAETMAAEHQRSMDDASITSGPTLTLSDEYKILVFRRQASGLAGFLVDISGDTLVFSSENQLKKARLKELKEVILIRPDHERGNIALYGMLLGAYLGNLAFSRATGQPSAYYLVEKEWNIMGDIIINAGYVGVGGGLGFLFGGSADWDHTFLFAGTDQQRRNTFNKLSRYVRNRSQGKSVHLSLQGARVFPRTVDQYQDISGNSGIYVACWPDKEQKMANNFNLLRKLELTYSISPHIQTGLAALWIGEPSTRVSYNATGYCVVGKYIFTSLSPDGKSPQFYIGGGLGRAKVDLEFNTDIMSDGIHDATFDRDVKKTALFGYALAGMDIYFTDAFSLGFVADYVLGPSYEVPEITEYSVTFPKVNVGNGSIGFSFGFHLL